MNNMEVLMPTSRTLKWGGSSAAIGGSLLFIDAALHAFTDESAGTATLAGIAHQVWHLPGLIGVVLGLYGLVAIYASQDRDFGPLGSSWFGLLFAGLALGPLVFITLDTMFLPVISQTTPLSALEESVAVNVFYVLVWLVGVGLGGVLFGIATVRAKVLSATGGWLLAAGGAGTIVENLAPGPRYGELLFGLALIVLGANLRSEPTDADLGSSAPVPTTARR